MTINHYFDQNRMEKKDGEYKINEHKEKGNDAERDGNQKITSSCNSKQYQTVGN